MTATRQDETIFKDTPAERKQVHIRSADNTKRHTLSFLNKRVLTKATFDLTIARVDFEEETLAQFNIYKAFFYRWFAVGGTVTTIDAGFAWFLYIDGVARVTITKQDTAQGGLISVKLEDLPDSNEWNNVTTLCNTILAFQNIERLGGGPDAPFDPNAHPDEDREKDFPFVTLP